MNNKNPYRPENSLGMIVRKAQTALHRRLFKNFQEAGLDVTPEQWAIMLMLMKSDGIQQNEIARRVARSNSSITRIIDNMAEKDLLDRRPHPTDRRTNLIYIKPKGKELQEELKKAAQKTLDQAGDSISEEKIEICKEVLLKVYQNLT